MRSDERAKKTVSYTDFYQVLFSASSPTHHLSADGVTPLCGVEGPEWHVGTGLITVNSQWLCKNCRREASLIMERVRTAVTISSSLRLFGRKVTSGMVLEVWADLAAGREIDESKPEIRMIRGSLDHQRTARPELFTRGPYTPNDRPREPVGPDRL